MGSLLDGNVVSVHPSTLKLHPKNPRQGNVAVIAQSLKKNQQFAPIVVQKSTGYVISGNHTLLAARELEWDAIDAVYVDVDDDQAHRIMLAANRTSEVGTFDDRLLLELLSDLPDLDGTGYDPGDLQTLEDLLAGAPTLDELADEYGDMSDEDRLKALSLKVDNDTAKAWAEHRHEYDNDSDALSALLNFDGE